MAMDKLCSLYSNKNNTCTWNNLLYSTEAFQLGVTLFLKWEIYNAIPKDLHKNT